MLHFTVHARSCSPEDIHCNLCSRNGTKMSVAFDYVSNARCSRTSSFSSSFASTTTTHLFYILIAAVIRSINYLYCPRCKSSSLWLQMVSEDSRHIWNPKCIKRHRRLIWSLLPTNRSEMRPCVVVSPPIYVPGGRQARHSLSTFCQCLLLVCLCSTCLLL